MQVAEPVRRPTPVLPKQPNVGKGLQNSHGQYNCFINVVVQALWHLSAFRERFLKCGSVLKQHCCPGDDSCVHCALQAIFKQYKFSEQSVIPPTVLRQALAVLYKDESRFQINRIDDAAEALEAILNQLHQAERMLKDKSTDKSLLEKKACPCLVHSSFGVRTMDLLRCRACSATTETTATSLFVAYAYTYVLREIYETKKNMSLSFCQLFRLAIQEDRRWCPNVNQCNAMCMVEHHLLYLPKVFSVGLVWPSAEGAPVKEIEEVLNMITMQIDLSNIFITDTAISRYLERERENQKDIREEVADSVLGSSVFDCLVGKTEENVNQTTKKKKVKCLYELKGMICYYGQHYNCYFHSPVTKQWYVFDDVTINVVGCDWSAVKARCLRGHLQPSVLFFEKKDVVEEEVETTENFVSLPLGETEDKKNVGREAKDAQKEKGASESKKELRQIILSKIEELLLQGEEEWKRERKRERGAEKLSQILEASLTDCNGECHSSELGCEDHQPEEEEEDQTRELHLQLIDKAPENIPEAQTLEEEWEILQSHDVITEPGNGSDDYEEPIELHSKKQRKEKGPYSPFVFIPPLSDELALSFTMIDSNHEEVQVTPRNWLFRRQPRLYRFTLEEMMHVDPYSQVLKDSFRYEEISHVLFQDPDSIVIRFKPKMGVEMAHCINGDGVENVARLLCEHNPKITLSQQ